MPSASVHTLVHIGAGNGCQLSKLTSNAAPVRTVLIEPLPSHADGLRRNHPNTEVWELAISCQHNNQPATLFEFNMSEASSLQQPSGLVQLYPGIKTVRQHQVQTKTPAAMMAELNLPEHESHLLIVEANGEETAIVQELAQQGLLQKFKQVKIALPITELYQNNYAPEKLEQKLISCHFELKQKNTGDPDVHIQQWHFNEFSYQLEKQRNDLMRKLTIVTSSANGIQAKLSELESKNKDFYQKNQELKKEQEKTKELYQENQKEIALLRESLKNTQRELETKKNSMREIKDRLESSEAELVKFKGYFQNRKRQCEESEHKIVDLEQQLANANVQISTLQKQLKAEKRLIELDKKIELLFETQAEQQIKNINALGQHVTQMHSNSNNQWQAILAVQHSLSFGGLSLPFTEVSINPELAQKLIELIQTNNYDLIIEFGSGNSTSLLSRTLLNNLNTSKENKKLTVQKNNLTVTQSHILPSEYDLPKRIVSFEHDKYYYKKTTQQIYQQGLSQVVDLSYSPLVSYSEQENSYLFYNCEEKIKQLAQALAGRDAHILVLVDGPSSSQDNKNSRYPALPYLLKYLSSHKLDLVLDDYHRPIEQNIADKWRSQLKKHDLYFTETNLCSEKSSLFLEINS
ncbi:hypothetical protein [Oceanimonas baumannii]|uniref:hypothetical protein n=1 Tax=Oceanimonas baumannii TaxID=129578 RepID=UPI003A9492E2